MADREPRVSEDQLDYRGKQRSQFWTVNNRPSETVQSDKHDADINVIYRKFAKTGLIDSLNSAEVNYMDISEFTDFADAMRNIRVAEMEFMKLPSKVREIFNHDPAEWLDAAHDPEKRQALVEAGFIEGPPVSAPEGAPGGQPAEAEASASEAED